MSTLTKTYRVYCYNSATKSVTADMIQAVDDADAIAKAEAAGFGSKCEVWDGKRLVAQLEDQRKSA